LFRGISEAATVISYKGLAPYRWPKLGLVAKVVSVQLKDFKDPVVVHNVEIIESGGPDLALHPPGNTGVSARFKSERVVGWRVIAEDRIS